MITFLSPIFAEISLFLGAIIIIIADIFFGKNKKEFFLLTYLLALIFCFISLYFITKSALFSGTFYHGMLINNTFTTFVKFVSVILLIFVTILSLNFLERESEISAEFLALLMISCVGGMFLISAQDFLTFYLGLELQALPLYLLASINRKSGKSSESGMKYFVLGSVSSALLLLGISLFYGYSGTTNFTAITHLYTANPVPPAVLLGFVLILIGMFFKVSAAPFHMWAPDVYEGSSAIVTTYFATIVKFTSALVLVRLFLDVSAGFIGIEKILIMVAMLSFAVGSFGAIKQNNIKRLLAYSSIGHIGFVMLSLAAVSLEGIKASVVYMTIYATLALGTFGFLNLIFGIKNGAYAEQSDEEDNKIFDISSFSGLSKSNPVMAALFAILLFSTAGIPPLAGFFSKFYAVSAAVKSGYFISSTLAVLFSVISAYYYLRVIKVMYFDDLKENRIEFVDRMNPKLVIGFVAAYNLFFMLFLSKMLYTIGVMLGF